ncbi:hypothetical protein PG997_010635 [Apiospora hydei]|uniref:Heterokaryon incompatibility domain-containing protein n=1 Tax=Apiospora hydei TaxID=1337664 RepID=A0ABR1VHS5_9PEZI
MGNTVSSTPSFRSCGLCYFKLPAGTPFLDQPRVSRRGIELVGLPDQGWKTGRLDDVLLPWKNIDYVEMETELDALRDSSGRGCVGCTAILQCLDAQLRDRGFTLGDQCWQDQCTLIWLVGDRKPYNPSLLLRVSVSATTKNQSEEHRVEEFSVSPSAAALGYTGSSASLEAIKTWLKNCKTAHEDCRQPAGVLPYRVVELSRDANGQADFRLVQGLGGREKYACLSHRWGPSTERCRTTSLTLTSYLERVPPDILPKTFREAGEVAMYLGLKYLWIDSLCIIQDDEDDWKAQAAEMCNIYQGSYITIAATSATQGDDGLFHTVPKFPVSPVESADRRDLVLADFPLLARGWVYQELLLSPRFVHFARDEAAWECAGGNGDCECGMAAGQALWPRKRAYRINMAAAPALYYTSAGWRQMASEYSTMRLTYDSDSLPAIAGVARQYGTKHRGSLGCYLAGLWEKSLVQDLLWYVPSEVKSARREASPVPSWSWASVTGGSQQLGSLQATTAVDPLELVSFRVDLAGPDEFGPIKYAEITVRGLLALGSWTAVPGSASGHRFAQYHPCRIISTGSSGRTGGGYCIDADYDFLDAEGSRRLEEGCTVFCLKTGFVFYQHHVCLILRPLNEERTAFERIGLLQTAHKDDVDSWYEGGQAAQAFKLL